MGVCLSCCGENSSTTVGESNERTRLLTEPVNSNLNDIHRVQSDEYLSRTPKQLPQKDEQSALSRILDQTATNVIDVGALDSHDLEQHEYRDRIKAYNARLNGLVRWSPPARSSLLLVDVPSPEKILGADILSSDNIYQVSTALKIIEEAVSEIRVEHKEDLVVPFRIP